MPKVVCPRCGETFYSEDHRLLELSPAALHIWQQAPESWKRGKVISLQVMALHTGYSKSQVHRALLELEQAGYVRRIARGPRKHVYVGLIAV